MPTYAIWVDLDHGANDLEFVDAVEAYLGHLRGQGTVQSWRIQRRMFGFGPSELGEFRIDIDFDDLSKLESAFLASATRAPEIEAFHREVYRRVRNFRSALYRDFPDAVRWRPESG